MVVKGKILKGRTMNFRTFARKTIGFIRSFHPNSKPALNNLDVKLAKYLNYKDGMFIEAGANDGYNQSNTYYLEKHMGWRGILVEGIPELFNKCEKNRPAADVFNYALVGDDTETVIMKYANLMSVVEGSFKSESLQREHVQTGLSVQGLNKTYEVKVPAITLEKLLNVYPNLPPIDFLSLDVEGGELAVLKGLNLLKYRPKYILVECNFYQEVNSFLISMGYRQVEKLTGNDYLYQAI